MKSGAAAPKFATALASAAIVVLDFLANFLLAKIGSALQKFAGKLKGLAQRLQKKGKTKGAKARARSKPKRAGARKRKATGPKRRRPAAKAKRPKGLAKAKPRAKRRPDKNNRDKDKRLKDAMRRERNAMRAADAAFARGVSEDQAPGLVDRIARRFKVSPIAVPGDTSWTIGFHGSPAIRRRKKTHTKKRVADAAARTKAAGVEAERLGGRFEREVQALLRKYVAERGGIVITTPKGAGIDATILIPGEPVRGNNPAIKATPRLVVE